MPDKPKEEPSTPFLLRPLKESDASQMPALNVLRLISILFCLTAFGAVANADDLSVPHGRVILTVSGNIAKTNVGNTAQFDRKMLEDLGMVDVTTATPWHSGRNTFSGVPVAKLLQHVQAQGETIKAVALNDYEVDIPLSDAWKTGVILAGSV
ncbi:oxidoreductase [Falsirhodobacter deserti]|uniref:oxidoreductase n=1 Tax=Falsirhodobacter deserti TaxID=1365611 RepID=UPI000FE41CBA|nr:oxidoreductase [Falsirhodobacter deserti]